MVEAYSQHGNQLGQVDYVSMHDSESEAIQLADSETSAPFVGPSFVAAHFEASDPSLKGRSLRPKLANDGGARLQRRRIWPASSRRPRSSSW